jgi:hypothetical protein
MENPSRSRGEGAGASIVGTATQQNTHAARPPGYEFVSAYGLGRYREADVWRADHAVLLHLRLKII